MKQRRIKPISYYIKGIQEENRFILGEAITLVESDHSEKRLLARDLVDYFSTKAPKNSLRLAITGPPGAGKSTFINALGKNLVSKDQKIAVLAIDPSSVKTKGSILGDKTRMYDLSLLEKAFVRPSPNSSYLGGVNRRTKESITLCEAAGFRNIIIETVGVGQSEFEVADISDLTILIMQPGSGDDLQGIKRGIMEMADIFVINKADAEQKSMAIQARQFLMESQKYLPGKNSSTKADNIFLCSSLHHTGIDEIVNHIQTLVQKLIENGQLEKNRDEQELKWFAKNLDEAILHKIYNEPNLVKLKEELVGHIVSRKRSGPKAIDLFIHVLSSKLTE
jgi:LAO/AO transport system kinase